MSKKSDVGLKLTDVERNGDGRWTERNRWRLRWTATAMMTNGDYDDNGRQVRQQWTAITMATAMVTTL
jgi:hypothetical protein